MKYYGIEGNPYCLFPVLIIQCKKEMVEYLRFS